MVEEQKTQEAADAAQTETPGVPSAPLKGIIGTKVGMTRVFIEDARMVPVTVMSAEGVVVSQVKSKSSDGYDAVQVAYGDVAERKLPRAEVRHLAKRGLPGKRWLKEFLVPDAAAFQVGQPVPVSVFAKGDWVQVTGVSKGKGFSGVIKRWGFGGAPRSHGHGEYRRAPGASGSQRPQRVLPGTRKPGHKGAVTVTEPKVEIVDVDAEKNLILLRGSVPGPNGSLIALQPTRKKVRVAAPQPTGKKGKK